MRSRLFLIVAICLTSNVLAGHSVLADDPATDIRELAPAKETVEFDGETLVLAWEGGTLTEPIKEYIPADESLESWTKLASIRIHVDLNDPEQIVGAVAEQLEKTNPKFPSDYKIDQDSGAAIIEFIMWPGQGDAGDAQFVEYNVFKYTKRPEGGLVAEQYALRAYGADIGGFLRTLAPIKDRVRESMMKSGLKLIPAERADKDPASTNFENEPE
jgi:hypothetical protein